MLAFLPQKSVGLLQCFRLADVDDAQAGDEISPDAGLAAVLQIEIHDGERPFIHQAEEGRRDDVYAAESIFFVFSGSVGEAFRLGLPRAFVDPSAEPRLVVEQQIAGGGALAGEQGGFVGRVQMVGVQCFQVYV